METASRKVPKKVLFFVQHGDAGFVVISKTWGWWRTIQDEKENWILIIRLAERKDKGDGAEVEGETALGIMAGREAEIVVIDLP